MKEITQPIFDGTYSITTAGGYKYMYLKSSGTLTIVDKAEYDLFCVGGGGGGGGDGGHGGCGGYTTTKKALTISAGSYTVTVGAGGVPHSDYYDEDLEYDVYSEYGGDGGTSKIVIGSTTISAKGGEGGNGAGTYTKGGSGGGASGYDWSDDELNSNGGNGGYDGNNGYYVAYGETAQRLKGSGGQGTTTRAFAETSGTLYAGGGGGGVYNTSYIAGAGGAGGGGAGTGKRITAGTGGTANTGGGGGGSGIGGSTSNTKYYPRAQGGSGLVIIRWKAA